MVIFRNVDALRGTALRGLIGLLDDEQVRPLPRLIATARRTPPRAGPLIDLLQRLGAIQIKLPPLRERREDIPLLVRAALDRQGAARRMRVQHEAMQALVQADWPGNVRQLENTLQAALAVARGWELTMYDLTDEVVAARKRTKLTRLEEAELEARRLLSLHPDGAVV